jgi:ribosome-binding factor A
MAGSTRQLKFAKLIQKEISDIFQQDKRKILDNVFITVADVKVSPDLGLAKIYISMLLAPDKKAIIEKINHRKSEVRKALGERIRKQVRVIPELVFYLDEVEENAQKMDAIIKNLHIPPASKSEEKE